MNYSLSFKPNRLPERLDIDARAYINAVVAAGATVSGAQKSAINTFFETGKADGWYSSLKRMYLPIWAAAAPNAIDMVSGTSGTFNGTVTHGAGFFKADGSTGYFDMGESPDSLGVSHGNEAYGVMYLAQSTIHPSGLLGSLTASSSPTNRVELPWITSSSARLRLRQSNVTTGNATVAVRHYWVTSSGSLSSRFAQFFNGGATILSTTNTTAETLTTNNNNIFVSAINSSGSATLFSNAEIAQVFVAVNETESQLQKLTLAGQTLWETLTGQTL